MHKPRSSSEIRWAKLASPFFGGEDDRKLPSSFRGTMTTHAGRTYPAQWWSRCRQLSSAAVSARPARPKVPGFFCMERYRGNSRGFSQLWEDSVTSVTMAFARLVDRRRAGVKSFLPVCHKADWPSSSIRCDPLLFGLSSRLCFLVCLSFQCLKTIQKIEKGKRYDFLEWPRLSIDEAWEWLSSSARTYFDLKMEKIPRTQYCWAVGLVLFGVDNFSTRTCSKRRGKV